MLKIGQIDYANCTPLFHVLREQFPCSGYEFVAGVPAELNRLLLSGEIDVCPSSSIEYAYHPELYTILPQLSISSIGAVASVLLWVRGGHSVPLEAGLSVYARLVQTMVRNRTSFLTWGLAVITLQIIRGTKAPRAG